MVSCPKCFQEVSPRAAYCDACGTALPGASMSLFELPGERSGRLARTLAVLVMDAILAGAGVVMVLAYLQAREAAARPLSQVVREGDEDDADDQAAPRQDRPVTGEVEVKPGRVVKPGQKPEQKPEKQPDDAPRPEKPTSPGTIGKPDDKPPAAKTPDAGTLPPIKDIPLPTVPGLPDAAPSPAVPDAAPAVEPPPIDEGGSDAGSSEAPPDTSAGEQELAEGVQNTINARMGQVRRCWENAAKSSADENVPQGIVEVEFTVLASGDASNVRVVSNDTQSTQLGDCVAAIVATWQFPRHEGEPVVFVWPFLFRPAK